MFQISGGLLRRLLMGRSVELFNKKWNTDFPEPETLGRQQVKKSAFGFLGGYNSDGRMARIRAILTEGNNLISVKFSCGQNLLYLVRCFPPHAGKKIFSFLSKLVKPRKTKKA